MERKPHLVGRTGVEGAVAAAVDRYGSVFAVEGDEIVAVPGAAHAVPSHRLLTFKLERDDVSVRRLLVIVEAVPRPLYLTQLIEVFGFNAPSPAAETATSPPQGRGDEFGKCGVRLERLLDFEVRQRLSQFVEGTVVARQQCCSDLQLL